ncbi:hypothetical protein [Salmonirosea aquatica]|uniref:DUF4386 family protein n=1 Tax=Salmonirosea aquatica TaxID=2654236 RepID=A0A7C9F904_9BACT|nr:hypothetical protein [Cytophagaceae bacterium SJW1-29]
MENSHEKVMWGTSMVIAPLFFVASSFAWQNGEYNHISGTLVVLGSIFWIPACTGLFSRLKKTWPRYSAWGLLVAIAGCVSGSSFGIRGLYADAFGISKEALLQKAAEYPLSFNLTMFWLGPLFPLSLIVLSIVLVRAKSIPAWTGLLLGLGAIAFPLSRIPRVEWVAHLADLLLFVPMLYIGGLTLMEKTGRYKF